MMTVKELKAKLEDAPDDARVMVNDEPLADVEVVIGEDFSAVLILWDVSHCEGT